MKALRRQHEHIADQRRCFCHQHSTALVREYDLIGIENLNVKGMAKGHFAKSILDAAWSIFMAQLTVKAECAGRRVVAVNPRGTSQTCPDCGRVAKKKLSERIHSCGCGLTCDRDAASARVILARALMVLGATRALTDSTSDEQLVAVGQADRMTCANQTARPLVSQVS